jgi:hypothetical protein
MDLLAKLMRAPPVIVCGDVLGASLRDPVLLGRCAPSPSSLPLPHGFLPRYVLA